MATTFGSSFGSSNVSSPTFRGNDATYDELFGAMGVGDSQHPQSYQPPPQFGATAQSAAQGSGYTMQAPQNPQYNGPAASNPYQSGYYSTPVQGAPQAFNFQQAGQGYQVANPQGQQGNNFGLTPNQYGNQQQGNQYGNYQSTYKPVDYSGQYGAIQGQNAPAAQQGQQGGMSSLDWYNTPGAQGQAGPYYGARVNPQGAPELMGTDGRQFNLANTQLFKDSEEAARTLMSGNVPGYDESSAEAREALRAAQAARTAQVRGDLINAGFGDSGRLIEEGVLGTANTDTAEMASLERGLAADKGALSMQGMQAGLSAAQGLMGQQSQGEQYYAQLGEGARQFDNKFEFDKWAAERGFDENAITRAWEDSKQDKQISSSEKIAFAGLSVEERQLAETARQFDSRFEFDVWAEQNQLDEAERGRVWGAMMTEKTMAHERDLAMLATDTDKWKVMQSENLTKLGWDQETALTLASLQADSINRGLDRELESSIARGQIDAADKDRALQAAQFKTKMDWDTWAKENDIAQADADRVWQSTEKAKDRVAVSLESSADRSLQYEIQKGNLAVEEWSIALQAMNAADRLEFDAWATKAGLDDAAADRVWQSTENAKTRQLDVGLDYLDKQFQKEGMSLAAVLPFLETMDPEQAWGVVKQLAGEAGIEVPEVFTSGNAYQSELAAATDAAVKGGTMTEDQAIAAREASKSGIDTEEDFNKWAEGNDIDQADRAPIWEAISTTSEKVKGSNNTAAYEGFDVAIKSGGKVDVRDARAVVAALESGNTESLPFDVASGSLEGSEMLRWDGKNPGREKDRWVLTDAAINWVNANTGKVYKANNGRLYEVVGRVTHTKDRRSSESIKFRDVVTGNEVEYSSTRTGGKSQNPFAGGGY
jgi:hypothetical protein